MHESSTLDLDTAERPDTTLPADVVVARIVVEPDDIIGLFAPVELKPAVRMSLRRQAHLLFPNHEIAVFESGIRIGAIAQTRPKTIAEETL